MKGKADKLLATRTLSALVVICVVLSALAGFLFFGGPTSTRAALGDLIVTGTFTIEDITQPVDGDIVVQSGGNLIVRNAEVQVISTSTEMHSITVQAGGTLTLDHGVITTYPDQIDPWPFLDVSVNGLNAKIIATNYSELVFPGTFTVQNNAQVSLTDTWVHALSDLSYFPDVDSDLADDCPIMIIQGSTMTLVDSTIEEIPEYKSSPAKNIVLTGSSTLVSINSYIGVDFLNATSSYNTHNVLELNDLSRAYLYGTSFEPGSNKTERSPAVVASGTASSPAVPADGGLGALAAVDGVMYRVNSGGTLSVGTWNVGGIPDEPLISSAAIVARYTVSAGFTGSAAIEWAREGLGFAPTTIVPAASDAPGTTAYYGLPLITMSTVGDVRNMNLRFTKDGTGYVDFDSIWVVFTVGANAYVYRWLNATVGSEYGVPIASATVTATFTGATALENQESFYFVPSGVSGTPPSEVLDYLGETPATFKITKSDGKAVIPYLTDILTEDGAVEQYVGTYAITGTLGADHSTQAFSFTPYPAMTSADQSFDFTVSIEGVVVGSPDWSRWLVVPPDMTIGNMTYYHAGDVIVAANGELTFYNAVFRVIQNKPFEHTIYVDNSTGLPTTLRFVNSRLEAAQTLKIIVKGMATLEIINSTLSNVMIEALEQANIVVDDSEIHGTISTEWNSDVDLTVTDSTLDSSPVLAGTSEGWFTDSSVPSIVVVDDAMAHVYRWIYVTVLDGAGEPLPGATIATREYASGMPAGTAISSESEDMLGIARVKSEATQITELEWKYVGTYWVNATYTHGVPYYTKVEKSVGVLPYEGSLSPNASYIDMQFDGVFPDLTVLPSPPDQITFNNTSPSPGDVVEIRARITNNGPGYAFDVPVAFYDDSDKDETGEPSEIIGLDTIPMLRPDETVIAVVSWTAGPPVFPSNHSIIAVPDPYGVITEMDESKAKATGIIFVRSLPDLYVVSTLNEITTSVTPVIVNSTVQLNALIHNGGSNRSDNVLVEFFDDGVSFATTTVSVPADNGQAIATVNWRPTVVKEDGHVIKVAVDPLNVIDELIDEGDEGYNNNASVIIPVLDYPDLAISLLTITPSGSVAGGNTVVVTGTMVNLNAAPVSLPDVVLYYNYSGLSVMLEDTLEIYGFTKNSGGAPATFSFTAPTLNATTMMSLVMIVNPSAADPVETNHGNNIKSGQVEVLDVRPDLRISSDDIYVQLGGTNRTGETFGRVVTVFAVVWNIGGSNATNVDVQLGVRIPGYNHSLHRGMFYNVSYMAPQNKVTVSFQWTINLTTPGAWEIWTLVDGPKSIDEPQEDNNWAVKPFTIQALVVGVVILTDDDEYKAGDTIMISATVMYQGTTNPVKRLPGVIFELYDQATDAVVSGGRTAPQTTDDSGAINVLLLIPTDIGTGSYGVRAVVLGTNYDNDPPTTVHISAAVGGGLFPWWVWVLIIVAVVGVVAGFFVYTYVYGLGKLVECGECGAFIPAASKRCPKCGVEFEVGTMKCSECGAWIPAESPECPNCGVKFVGEAEAEEDYMERMRAQYEDQVASKYREIAKTELGRKYNDKTFEAWWRQMPGYISFEDWLAKEEEKKKEGPVPCPVCGTLNPKEATVCHKCGTVFAVSAAMPPRRGPPPAAPPAAPERPAAVEEAPPVQEAAPPVQPGAVGAPRMVIRRPIDRKVVPKKIIKTPLGEEKTEGEENQ